MYEELIKALKNCNYPNCGYYCSQGCVMSHDGSTCELIPLLRKAADVIEELQKPKWIQFTSRELTEEEKAEHPDLKFYYVRSIGEYWIGRRIDNFYYAEYDPKSRQWVWTHSRYLPWGKHVVSPTSLWKEHTYPSEPEEIPFEEWLQGFIKKYAADAVEVLSKKEKTTRWIPVTERLPECNLGAEVGNIEWISCGMVHAGCFGRGGKYRDAYFRTWTDAGEGMDAKDADYWRAVTLPEPPKDELIAKQEEDAEIFMGSTNYGDKVRYDEAMNAVANIVNAPTVIEADKDGET